MRAETARVSGGLACAPLTIAPAAAHTPLTATSGPAGQRSGASLALTAPPPAGLRARAQHLMHPPQRQHIQTLRTTGHLCTTPERHYRPGCRKRALQEASCGCPSRRAEPRKAAGKRGTGAGGLGGKDAEPTLVADAKAQRTRDAGNRESRARVRVVEGGFKSQTECDGFPQTSVTLGDGRSIGPPSTAVPFLNSAP